MTDNILMISISMARDHAKRALAESPDLSLDDLLRTCMRESDASGMITTATSEEPMFKAACAAAYDLAGDDDKDLIKEALEGLRDISAMLSGVPVDLDALTAKIDAAEAAGRKPPKLRVLWDEVKKEKKW